MLLYERLRRRDLKHQEDKLTVLVMAGLDCINKLSHPYLLTQATLFRDTPLDKCWELHEFHRNVGNLVYLDTLEAIHAFKEQGILVVFLSYQWLSWSQSGPDPV